MVLTEGGRRLLGIASQIVALGAEAVAAVQPGGPARLHVVMDGVLAEHVAGPLVCLFNQRKSMDASTGVAATAEMPLLLTSRLADVAVGPQLTGPGLVSRPVLRCRLVAVAAPHGHRDHWLVGPSGTDPAERQRPAAAAAARTGVARTRLRQPDGGLEGCGGGRRRRPRRRAPGGVPGPARGTGGRGDGGHPPMPVSWYATVLEPGTRSASADAFLDFLTTPAATQVMRSPDEGIPRARFRPPGPRVDLELTVTPSSEVPTFHGGHGVWGVST
ncbi:LysR family transcriptional regulator [Nonomuraea ferruginea]